ncbi:MAG: RDD family protein [Solirubrobacteraceae bacterium]
MIDRLLSSGAFDRIITVVINHPATEALVVNVVDEPALERLISRVMDSRLVDGITAQLVASEEMQLILDYVTRSPELRAALAHQTAGMAGGRGSGGQVANVQRRRGGRALRASPAQAASQARATAVTEETPIHIGYAGLVTRAVAIGIDALVINGIAVITGAIINLIAALFGHEGDLSPVAAVLGGAAWSAAYFTLLWSLTGQTPGDRLMGIRVFSTSSDRILIRQAFVRYWAMLLAALPLGAGFVPVLTDDRRRGLHDRIANTVVRWDEGEEVTAIADSPVAVTPVAELGPGADAGTMHAGHAPIA